MAGTLIFLMVYLFVAASPIGPDLYFEPVWTVNLRDARGTVDLSSTEAVIPAGDDLEWFVLGSRYGYFTPSGTMIVNERTGDLVTGSRALWSVYGAQATESTVRFRDGASTLKIPAEGYPFAQEDRLFLFVPGGDTVSRYTANGLRAWTVEHSAPLTAFNSSPGGTILGYADGKITLMGESAEILSFYPGGSDREVILGADVSNDASLIACVSGIDRQRFVLSSVKGSTHRVIYHTYLEGNARRQVSVKFDPFGTLAFFETAGGIGVADLISFQSWILPLSGTVVAIGDSAEGRLFTILTRDAEGLSLSAVEYPNHVVATERFSGHNAFLKQVGTTLYLGIDESISRIDIRGIE